MLPPIQISQNSVAYQATRADGIDPARTAATPPTVAVTSAQTGLDVRSAIAGRVSILLLSGPERTTESFAIMAELFGHSLGIERRENETQASYMLRLAEALHALPPTKLQIVEQQLAQLFNGLALKTVIGAFTDPSGPDAAIMTMNLEVTEDADARTPARFASMNYQLDMEDGDLPAHVVRPNPLVPPRSDIGSTHLKIVASSDAPGIQYGTGTARPAPASRPAIDIRGVSDTTGSALVLTTLAESRSTHAVGGVYRTSTQVTIDINARAPVDNADDQPALQSRGSATGGDWRQHVQPGTAEESHAETYTLTAKANGEHGLLNRRNAAHFEEPLQAPTDRIPVGQPVLQSAPQLAMRVEGDADDALGQFLRASLAASFISIQRDSDGQQALRGRETIPFTGSDSNPINAAAEQQPDPLVQTEPDAKLAERAVRASLQEPEIPIRPEIVQALQLREPVGFPTVGYPYANEEENGRRPERGFDGEHDEDPQDDGDPSDQQNMSGQQEDENDPSRDETGSVDPSPPDDEPAMTPRHRGTSDSANDLYWRMAGWA